MRYSVSIDSRLGDLDIHGIGHCCQWHIALCLAIKPHAQQEAKEGCGRYRYQP